MPVPFTLAPLRSASASGHAALPPALAALRTAAPAWTGVLALLGLAVLAERVYGVPFAKLARDPLAGAGASYTGLLSNVGVLLWSGAATACLFSGAVLGRGTGDAALRRFLLCSGLLTCMLLADDLFLLHEELLPGWTGVPEKAVLAGYGALTLFWLVRFRGVALRTEPALLALALGCFAVSVLADARDRENLLLEDGAKLLGIATWLVYFARAGASALRRGLPARDA